MKNFKYKGVEFVILVIIGSSAPAAFAQEQGAADETAPNDIVVTARKRNETLQDIPISITALSGDTLARSGADDFAKFSKAVPSLSFIDLGPGQSQLSIRGVNTGAIARDDTARKESVGVYLNEIPVSVALFNPDLDTFDLDRVEVLRGPQGTLYGAGSLSGTVRLISTQPDLSREEIKADLSLSQTRGSNNPNWSVKGALNLPISADLAAVRLVGYYNEHDGFIDNIAGGSDVNRDEKYGVRASALITPTADLRISPSFVWQRIRTWGYPLEDVQSIIGSASSPDVITNLPNSVVVTPDPLVTGSSLIGNPIGGRYQQYRQRPEGLEDDFKVYSLQLDYDIGAATITSVSSLLKRDVAAHRDFTYFMNSVFGALPSVNYDIVPTDLSDATQLSTFTQEVRIGSSGSGPFDWVAGFFYQREERDYAQVAVAPGFDMQTGYPSSAAGLGADVLYQGDFSLSLRQFAIFGEATMALTDRLKATAGVRWYDYTQSRDVRLEGLLNDFAVTEQYTSTAANGVNPRFILSYEPNRDLLISAQASKGFKLGGPTDPLPAICVNDPEAGNETGGDFDPESLWNYEASVKSSLAGGRLTINGSAFWVNYNNLQLNRRLACSFTVTTNSGKARSKGVELEISARPTPELTLGLSGSYVNAVILDDQPSLNARAGDRLPLSPKYSFSANGRYSVPISDQFEAYVDASYQYVGSVVAYFNSSLPGSPPVDLGGNRLPSYGLVNLRIGASSRDYQFSLFVDNLFDKRAALSIDRERVNYLVVGTEGRDARFGIVRNRPRTVGINARLSF